MRQEYAIGRMLISYNASHNWPIYDRLIALTVDAVARRPDRAHTPAAIEPIGPIRAGCD